MEGVRGKRRARGVRGSCDGLGGGGDGAVGGGDPGREHAAEGVKGCRREAVLGEGGYEGGPCGGGGGSGEVEEGAEGKLGERAAGVEGEEVVGEQRVRGGDGGEMAALEKVAMELLALGERAGG